LQTSSTGDIPISDFSLLPFLERGSVKMQYSGRNDPSYQQTHVVANASEVALDIKVNQNNDIQGDSEIGGNILGTCFTNENKEKTSY
jgi:hypothetical protein